MSKATSWFTSMLSPLTKTAGATGVLAVLGAPGLRAALHGARIGAGKAMSPEVLERMGIAVGAVAHEAREAVVDSTLTRGAREAAVVLKRGGRMLRVGAKGVVLRAKDGVTLEVQRSGVARAAVPLQTVSALARGTSRFALRGLGRAASQGAVAGAVLDGGAAAVKAGMAVRRGEVDGRTALGFVGRRFLRGAVAGGAGVAAAGVVSAGLAATGLVVLGLPVALPLAAMTAASLGVARAFDHWAGPEALE